MQEKKKKKYDVANCQSRSKKLIIPVKTVRFPIKAVHCNVLTMMENLLFVQYTQPKYRDLSTNNTHIYKDGTYFIENNLYHCPTSVYNILLCIIL